MLEEGKGWKSSFHPPRAPPQLKLLQPISPGARGGVGTWHCGWDPGSGRCSVRLLPSRGSQAGAGTAGGARPAHRRPPGPCSIALRQHSRPVSPPLASLLLSSLILRRDMKG